MVSRIAPALLRKSEMKRKRRRKGNSQTRKESEEELDDNDDDDDDVYEENLLCCAVCGLPPEPPMLRCWRCDKFYHRACLGKMTDTKWNALAFATVWACNTCKSVGGGRSTATTSTPQRRRGTKAT